MSDKNKLRIYFGPHDSPPTATPGTDGGPGAVEVSLQDLLDTFQDAIKKNRTWVDDFRKEKVVVSKDLHEIMTAYQHLKRSA